MASQEKHINHFFSKMKIHETGGIKILSPVSLISFNKGKRMTCTTYDLSVVFS